MKDPDGIEYDAWKMERLMIEAEAEGTIDLMLGITRPDIQLGNLLSQVDRAQQQLAKVNQELADARAVASFCLVAMPIVSFFFGWWSR